MDDFGNIIYVLIAVGWFLLNAYKKSQQNKTAKSQRPGSEPIEETHSDSPRSLEDMIMEQLRGVTGKESVEPVREPVPVHKNKDKFLSSDLTHSHLDASYQMSKGEMKSHRVQRQVRTLEAVEEAEDSLMDRLLPDGFDLQQAVVMNAILDRPYK